VEAEEKLCSMIKIRNEWESTWVSLSWTFEDSYACLLQWLGLFTLQLLVKVCTTIASNFEDVFSLGYNSWTIFIYYDYYYCG